MEVEWLIGLHTQNIVAYLSIVTTQHKIRKRRVRHSLMSAKVRGREEA